jgi:hypothetical protein
MSVFVSHFPSNLCYRRVSLSYLGISSKSEADKIISNYKESKENLAVAYLKKAQCLLKLGPLGFLGFIGYEKPGAFFPMRPEIF